MDFPVGKLNWRTKAYDWFLNAFFNDLFWKIILTLGITIELTKNSYFLFQKIKSSIIKQ